MKSLRAHVVKDSWSGHGEGGTLVSVRIKGWRQEDIYNSTQGDYETAKRVAKYVNECLKGVEALERMENG
jgi:hypothetical protein